MGEEAPWSCGGCLPGLCLQFGRVQFALDLATSSGSEFHKVTVLWVRCLLGLRTSLDLFGPCLSSPDEPKQLLPIKVSVSLEQALRKLDLSSDERPAVHGSVGPGKHWVVGMEERGGRQG